MDTAPENDPNYIITYNHKLPREERVQMDGKTKMVGVVIKQSSFLVIIASQTAVLEGCTVNCTLLYDNDTLSVCFIQLLMLY